MPASDATYRKSRTLHIVFAVSSLAMTATVVWMILADHNRPWKEFQREFQGIETDKLQAQQSDALRRQEAESARQLKDLRGRKERAEAVASENRRRINDLDARISTVRGEFQLVDQQKRFQKAALDSLRSLYDGMIDREEVREANNYLAGTIRPAEQDYDATNRRYDLVARRLAALELEQGLASAEVVVVEDAPPPGTPAAKAGFLVNDTMTVDDFERLQAAAIAILKGEKAAAALPSKVARNAGATTIEVPVAPIESPDRPESDLDAWSLFGLVVAPQTPKYLADRIDDLTRESSRIAGALEIKEQQYGEGSGFGGFYNKAWATLRGLPVLDLAAPPVKINQISLPQLTIDYNFKEVPRYDRCTTCHLGIDRAGYDLKADGTPMPAVFQGHPRLTEGAEAVDPKGNIVPAGLYLDSNGPHPINQFGCTICHEGQGSGTSFTYASHTPDSLEEQADWERKYDWHEMHHWDFPMRPDRFIESGCLKCHHEITDLGKDQAPKVIAGYERITRYGCTGCHVIGGADVNGPDLTDNRQVGPNLAHVASKVGRDWMLKWIKNPHAFRPDSRMPRFYGVTNNDAPSDQPRADAEVHALVEFLISRSTPPERFIDPPAEGDAEAGRNLFLQKGCLACHSNRPYAESDLPSSLVEPFNANYQVSESATYPPEMFPEAVRQYAQAEYGPNLSSMAAKFTDRDDGYRWLFNWIRAPESYHPRSLMPNLQLTDKDSADIAAWIVSTREDWGAETPESLWPAVVEVGDLDSQEVKDGLDELTYHYLSKSKLYNERTILLSEVGGVVDQMSRQEKLLYVGEKTVTRLGCYGCHNISGFEAAKPIGTPLNGWGSKSPTRLDFAHIAEYLTDQVLGEEGTRDGTTEFYQEKLGDHQRLGFLYQKLHRPRSYDYKKDRDDILAWDERLRMPQFSWADDPEAVEEVMTFILGLTGEEVPMPYLPRYEPAKAALAKGERLLERYNCRGCHTLAMPKYTIAARADLSRVFKSFDPDDPDPFQTNVSLAFDSRAKDYLGLLRGPAVAFEPGAAPTIGPPDEQPVTIEAMPIGVEVMEDDQGRPLKTLYAQVWRPVTIRGFTFNIGDTLVLDPDAVATTPAEGGDFAWLYSAYLAEQTGEPMATAWNALPPPLIREGDKVQTPWLTRFFHDPYKIRPAAQLRMPRFHYGATPTEIALGAEALGMDVSTAGEGTLAETRDLANYFAARDGVVFPYQETPQREQSYLAAREAIFGEDDASTAAEPAASPGEDAPPEAALAGLPTAAHPSSRYLAAGWSIITKNQCVQCHAIGQYVPTGDPKTHGPNLRQVSDRLRPDYMLRWIGQPARTIPYTAMPQVFPPSSPEGTPPLPGIPAPLEGKPLEQVRSVRDTLLNYVSAVEQQLAEVAPPPEPAAVEGTTTPADPSPPPQPGAE